MHAPSCPRRASLALLALLLTTACGLLPGAVQPTPSAAPTVPGPAYTGQFDCEGTEGGLRAYAGRVTVQPGGLVTFKDYDGMVQTGTWTYDPGAATFTFNGSTVLASALYNAAADSLVVVFAPNVPVVHAISGMKCQRAVPGKTGPP